MKFRQWIVLSALLLLSATTLKAQTAAVKTNLLGWATTTLNIGAELGVGQKSTVQIFGALNPWDFGDEKHFRIWNVEPEYRYWFCEKFNGHFIGVHALGGQYNAKNMNFPLKSLIIGSTVDPITGDPASEEKGWPDLTSEQNKGRHVEGWYAGAGITYGYQWMLSRHWNFEGSVGLGYDHIKYRQYPCVECGALKKRGRSNYFGPTKLALSLIYVF